LNYQKLDFNQINQQKLRDSTYSTGKNADLSSKNGDFFSSKNSRDSASQGSTGQNWNAITALTFTSMICWEKRRTILVNGI
jgi:hypothetical protein